MKDSRRTEVRIHLSSSMDEDKKKEERKTDVKGG